jgi:hypothetical protein
MDRRARRVVLGLSISVVVLAVLAASAIPALPSLARRLAIARLEALTGRPATIDSLAIDLRHGAVSVRGVRVTDRDGEALATIGHLDARLRLRSILRGHVWLHDLAIDDSTVRVVRDERGEFNLADMIDRPGSGGPALDVTVDRFTVSRGTVVLEDRSISPARVWKSENLAIAARNVSTRRDDGEAHASSTINGSPVTVRVERLRLVPVHLRAVVRAQQVDLAVAGIYLPAGAPVVLDRGRLDTTVAVSLDARAGLRVDVDGRIADARVIRRRQGDPVLIAPSIRVAVRDFTAATDGALAVGRLEVDGATTLVNGEASPPARFDLPRVTVLAEGLAWPVQGPARVAVTAPVPGGGHFSVRGDVKPQPPSADVDVRMTRVNLAPWARYIAPWLRVSGTGEIALAVQAALHPAVTATGRGVARLNGVVVTDGHRRLLAFDQAEASGVEAQWPSRVAIGRLRVRRPSATVERDAQGTIGVPGLAGPGDGPGDAAADTGRSARAPAARPTIAVEEIRIEDGAVTWRDRSVTPVTTLAVPRVNVVARQAAWPMTAPVAVDASAATPGGGTVRVDGRLGVDPLAADVRVKARGVAVAPYAAYVPMRAAVAGYVDADVSATVARDPRLQARVVGSAGISRVTVQDGKRRVVSAGRVEARGLDVDWPARVDVERLILRQPWVLVERDEGGGLPLRALLLPPARASGAAPASPPADEESPARDLAIRVGSLAVQDGGARIVDRAVSPAYAEDVSRMWLQARGVATASETPARIDLKATIGPAGMLLVRGTVGALHGSPSVDLTGEVRDLAVTRLNPYLRHFVGWAATSGRLSVKVGSRVSGDRLAASSAIHLGRLQVERAARDDAARERIGLPLGLIVGLLKDGRGDIRLSLPVGGRLDDPRFDYGEAIWGAARTVAVKAMALPVSWIGRLRVGPDARVADVEIDPLTFEVGTATVAAESAPQMERLTAFLRKLSDVRLIATPVVSLGDLEALKARTIDTRVKALSARDKVSEVDAARRLFGERVPGREPPDDAERVLAALREMEPPPADEATALARERGQAVRDALRNAGVDGDRIAITRDAGALETFDAGRVEFGLTDQLRPRRTLADLLRALLEKIQRGLTAAAR